MIVATVGKTEATIMERWLKAPYLGYEDLYEVSSYGKIRQTRSQKVLIASTNNYGYLFVGLRLYKKTKFVTLHDAVCRAFHGEPPAANTFKVRRIVVRHRDGDQKNNHWRNLRWGAYKKNEEDKRRHGTKPLGRAGKSKLTLAQVVEIRKTKGNDWRNRKVRTGLSAQEIASKFNVSFSAISRICRHEQFDVANWIELLETMIQHGNTALPGYREKHTEAKILLGERSHPDYAELRRRFKDLSRPR